MNDVHNVKIYYHDTDCGGVVYYANYLKYMEEARTEYFQSRGISFKALGEDEVLFVVARQEIDYKFPAVYGDTLAVETSFEMLSPVRLAAQHRITNQDNKLICAGKTTLVCVDRQIKPRVIPDSVKDTILA